MCKCHSACVEEGQRTSYESQFSATIAWVLGMELKFSALAAGSFTCCVHLAGPTSLYLLPLVLFISWGKAKHTSIRKFLTAKYGSSLSHLVLAKPWLDTKWTGDATQMVVCLPHIRLNPSTPRTQACHPKHSGSRGRTIRSSKVNLSYSLSHMRPCLKMKNKNISYLTIVLKTLVFPHCYFCL